MSSVVLLSEASNDCAVPWKPAWMLAGMPRSALAWLTAFTAAPSEAPGARLKETVTTGNCPWWLTASGVVVSSTRVKAPSGTEPPVVERRKMSERSCGLRWKPGLVSSTTRYWLSWVNMVEIWRWPKAS